MGKLCPEQTDLSCAPMARLAPIDLDLVDLARWASLFVSAALAAHQQPAESGLRVQFLGVAAELQRMLGRVYLPQDGVAGQTENKVRTKGRVGKA